jgi:hypothetical protein
MSNHTRKAEHLKVDPPVVFNCDKPTMTQNWALISFISPEDRVKQRFLYEANRFLYHDVNKQIMDTTAHLAKNINAEFTRLIEKKIATYKSSNDPIYKAAAEILDSTRKEIVINEDEQVNKTLRTYKLDQEDLVARFDAYKTQNGKELEVEFNKEYTDQTSVRGFKIRGTYEDLAEAKARANTVRQEVESFVHTFVAPVGYWCPWDPNADSIQDQEYMINELNEMMRQKKRNAEQKDEFFEKRKQMLMDNVDQTQDKELKEKLTARLKEQRNQRKKK